MIISDHRIKNEQKQDRDVSFDPFFGSMSIVGVGFYKSRSIIAFEAIFMFFVQMHIFLHGKQTFKCQS